jgi:hypothetical protein
LPKGFFEGENEEVISYRKKYLQSFFDELIRHKAIMCYNLTETFLKEEDPANVDSVMCVELKAKAPEYVKEMTHVDGLAHVKLTEDLVNGCAPIQNYIKDAKNAYTLYFSVLIKD